MTAVHGAPEVMAVSMARRMRDQEVVFFGVNSPLPMVAIHLAKRLHAPRMTVISIAGGVDGRPDPLPLSTLDHRLLDQSACIFPNSELYDLFARGGVDAGFLGFAQVDALGRVNSTVLGPFDRPATRFPGGGGAAFILPTVKRVILWRAAHSRRVFVPECDFVTAAGNVDRIVTPLCVFRPGPNGLMVESVHAFTTLDDVANQTGFPLLVPEEGVAITPSPTAEELAILAEIDPHRYRASEFG